MGIDEFTTEVGNVVGSEEVYRLWVLLEYFSDFASCRRFTVGISSMSKQLWSPVELTRHRRDSSL